MHRPSRPFAHGGDPCATFNAHALLASAARLRRMACQGSGLRLLHGRNLALLCAAPEGEAQELFRRAATELGAQVAGIAFPLPDRSCASELQHAARLLGRLYDAVECQGLPVRLVRRLAREAGIPFFEGLACPAHPTAALCALLESDLQMADRRCLILQAALLDAIG